jgi:tetratricopeptide (TPR) repeat protein
MRALSVLRRLLPAVTLPALLAACAALAPVPPPVSDNAAVLALVDQAHAEAADRRLQGAMGTMERALRIEPRNPYLWQELARLHLAQGDYDQTESLAARSNSWAGTNRQVRAANWRLIAEARLARGDEAGAREAEDRARQLER